MARALLIGGVVVASLALLSQLVALGSTHWMTACSPIGSILKAVDPSGSSSASLSQSGVPPGLDSADLCINMGLFQLSFGVDKLGISYNIGLSLNSLDRFIEATAGLLVSGVILLIISIVLLLIGLCSRSMNPQRKVSARAYTRIGAVVMIVATLLFGIGATVYTAEQSKAVHHSNVYLKQLGSGLQSSSFGSMFGKFGAGDQSIPDFPQSPHDLGRKRRQSYNPFENAQVPPLSNGNGLPTLPSFGPYPNLDSENLSNYPVKEESLESHASSYDSSSVEKIGESFLNLLDPVFGYSFYMTWVAFVLSLFASILCAFVFHTSSAFADDMHPVL